MGGYALTEMNEYEMNESLERFFREITGKEDVPVKVLLTKKNGDPYDTQLRGIALYEGTTYNFIRLTPQQACRVMVKSDLCKSQAVIRESYNMTVVRSKTLRAGMVYEPF
ncbi:hypothetical protein pEaSNUABM8_00076 [Erwinia phage pEa_SNUABM_8]|nr:hypothetical protein pEaSNUABM8_00076 [Erwinia phage pEa_SNUABM_8]QVW54828.1 hypothetical protein pEaSNUABM4_00075 [Erwinia phage pEa_SNUABM_4]